jgi:hypothetical protein
MSVLLSALSFPGRFNRSINTEPACSTNKGDPVIEVIITLEADLLDSKF